MSRVTFAILGILISATLIALTSCFLRLPRDTSGSPQTVQLFYYNQKRDLDQGNGNAACSADAVLPVIRTVPRTQTPIQETLHLLLRGDITSEERAAGFQTEFPHPGFDLQGASLKDGVLTLKFPEIPGFTDGGSCRMSILTAQIQKTALQFPGVDTVRFQPETLFQP